MYKIVGGKKIYDEDITCIVTSNQGIGGIYIGNLEASQNIQTLRKYNIKSVLTSCAGIFLTHSKTDIPFYLYIPAQDHQKFDLKKYFNQAISFIEESLLHTNILVHCMAGISRSVALVLAYFIKSKSMSYEQAYKTIKYKRKIINPNHGFVQQLRTFAIQLKKQRENNLKYSLDKKKLYTSSYCEDYSFQKSQYLSFLNPNQIYKSKLQVKNKYRQQLISKNKNSMQNNLYSYFNGQKYKTSKVETEKSQYQNTNIHKWYKIYKQNKDSLLKNDTKIKKDVYQKYSQKNNSLFQTSYQNVDKQIQEIKKRYFNKKQNNINREYSVGTIRQNRMFNKSIDDMTKQDKLNKQNRDQSRIKYNNWLLNKDNLLSYKNINKEYQSKFGSIKYNSKRTSKVYIGNQNLLLY